MKASVVINTYNRGAYLGNAIQSIRQQTHRDTELIVVDGPSTDNTQDVLRAMQEAGCPLKVARCESRNLSESRNIGIAHASGDVVLFIDDDGVAHPEWVSRIMAPYHDPRVGAVGGFTFDHTGIAFQCRYTVCDRRGNAYFFNSLDPGSAVRHLSRKLYPSLLGTNSSFRRESLIELGGFDEVFAYMLDETDVCLRVHDKGLGIVTVPDAYVFHKYAPSHSRSAERIPTSLLAPARSKVYFMLKHHAKGMHDAAVIFSEVDRYKKDIEFSNRWYLDHNKIPVDQYARLSNDLHQGVAEGLQLGLDPMVKRKVSAHLPGEPTPFLPVVNADETRRSLKIYFVSQGYPPHDTSGIARWTQQCAASLSALGHEVHVVTRSRTESNHVDFIGGIWVHAVVDAFPDDLKLAAPADVPDSIAVRGMAVLREIQRAQPIWGCDLVSAPIWDAEGLFCARYLDVPVVTSLHTTYLLALPFKPEWTSNREYRLKHVNRVIDGERWLMQNSTAILANSRQIVLEINAAYQTQLGKGDAPLGVVPHGVEGPGPDVVSAAVGPPVAGCPRVLFVGRIEQRKGQDLVLSALLQMPRGTPDFELLFAGSANPQEPYVQNFERLLAQVRTKFPRSKIEVLGYVTDNDLNALYRSCDIFVATSRFESFGLILIEAMRHAKPVVSCKVGGIPEVVSDGQEGYLVNVDDTVGLSDRLQRLLTSPDLRKRMGAAAKLRYEREFTLPVMAHALEAFYLTVLNQEKRHG